MYSGVSQQPGRGDRTDGLGYRLKERGFAKEAATGDKTGISHSPSPLEPHASTSINMFWEEYRPQYLDRPTIIEQAIASLQTQTLTEQLRQQAQREAHTLKGSLGLFDLDDASELSRQIEQLLKTDLLSHKQQAQLVELTLKLHQAIEQPFPETPSKPTAKVASFSLLPQSSVLPQRSQLLTVDDDAQLLNVVQAMLQPWGFQIALLSNPQQFWGNLKEVKPNLLMLDIEMPEVNGIDLCQGIRNDSQWDDLPILMISANNDDETIQRVFMAGADDYVSKPIRAAELVARVIRRLEHAMVLKKLRGLEN